MKVIAKAGRNDIATVYIAEMNHGKRIEFVESIPPPNPLEKKWVLIVSSLYGCPVGCRFCDAGNNYEGKLSKHEIISQIDYMIKNRFPDGKVPVEKFKIQFARMGEPAFNQNVIYVLQELPKLYEIPGFMPSVSTIAPKNSDKFFEDLLEVKEKLYKNKFQLQFSIHTTDLKLRDWLIPVEKWSFEQIAEYGDDFYQKGDRKITLNFALMNDAPIDPDYLSKYFNPDKFLVKITPVNPTHKALNNDIKSHVLPDISEYPVINNLRKAGYDVILSIGELEENYIGSNCGQYLENYKNKKNSVMNGYTYEIKSL